MSSSAQALGEIEVGDLIFGLGAGGQEMLLLVYKADQRGFSARHVMSQRRLRFGRDGRTPLYANGGSCTIVSTAALPDDMREVALGLDRKFGSRPKYPDTKLTTAEIQLVLTQARVFKASLIPGTESIVRTAERLNAIKNVLRLEWDPVSAPDNSPAWDEYSEYLPALVELLDRSTSVDDVADFLADIASQSMRTEVVGERSETVAASLIRLQQGWT